MGGGGPLPVGVCGGLPQVILKILIQFRALFCAKRTITDKKIVHAMHRHFGRCQIVFFYVDFSLHLLIESIHPWIDRTTVE